MRPASLAWLLLVVCCLTACTPGPVFDERVRLGSPDPLRMRVGERVPAMRPGLGIRPPVGGFVPTLVSDDATIVEVHRAGDGRDATAVDLIARKPGRTLIRLANALGLPQPMDTKDDSLALLVEVK